MIITWNDTNYSLQILLPYLTKDFKIQIKISPAMMTGTTNIVSTRWKLSESGSFTAELAQYHNEILSSACQTGFAPSE